MGEGESWTGYLVSCPPPPPIPLSILPLPPCAQEADLCECIDRLLALLLPFGFSQSGALAGNPGVGKESGFPIASLLQIGHKAATLGKWPYVHCSLGSTEPA